VSPRHVPDEVLVVPALPHTLTGKRLEVPVKRILQGAAVEDATNSASVDDPAALRWFADLARQRSSTN
jgi:acetoacetyl-CoA synthetase